MTIYDFNARNESWKNTHKKNKKFSEILKHYYLVTCLYNSFMDTFSYKFITIKYKFDKLFSN